MIFCYWQKGSEILKFEFIKNLLVKIVSKNALKIEPLNL